MDEVTGLDRFEPVPETVLQTHASPDRSRTFVPTPTACSSPSSKSQFHRADHDVEELITVRMDLTTMRSRPIDGGDSSDCVSIDPPRRAPGWADVMVIDQSRLRFSTLSFKLDRWVRGSIHATDCSIRVRVTRKSIFPPSRSRHMESSSHT